MNITRTAAAAAALMMTAVAASAQNPIIRDNFSADPSAHVFDGRVYVYPSHDIPAPYDYARKDWFCMADYHVYSSDNLVDWFDHGVIVDQKSVPWVNSTSYSMWAPDCNYKNGKYYFYFPAGQKPKPGQRFAGNGIGVAVSDTPYGPFVCQEEPIKGIGGIDPCIFIDDDGTPYLTWSGRGLQIARLKDNMLELDSEPVAVSEVPDGFKEGPYLFKRNGIYYYTFPWVEKDRECLAYCMSDKPMGPYVFKGKIMEQSETECWTNHHSVVEFKGQWYLFYHHNDYSPYFDKNRSVCVDEIHFNPDGTIVPVVPTFRGVGITPAHSNIQIDRYSDKDEAKVDIEFLRDENTFEGWKTVFHNTASEYKEPIWIRYDRVDFGKGWDNATLRCHSLAGGKIEVRADAIDGPLVAEFKVGGVSSWNEITVKASSKPEGVHDLFVLMTEGNHIDVDWVSFK